MGVRNHLQRIKAAAREPGLAWDRVCREVRPVYRGRGTCPICETEVTFKATREWFRDHLFCSGCGSIPRERALMQVIKDWYPDWQQADLH